MPDIRPGGGSAASNPGNVPPLSPRTWFIFIANTSVGTDPTVVRQSGGVVPQTKASAGSYTFTIPALPDINAVVEVRPMGTGPYSNVLVGGLGATNSVTISAAPATPEFQRIYVAIYY